MRVIRDGALLLLTLVVGANAAPAGAPTGAPTAPTGMLHIAAGEFTMGTDDANSLPNERPAHRVKLDAFWIDATQVTNAEFRKFVDATKYVTTAEKAVDW